jgi:hypothetical protein
MRKCMMVISGSLPASDDKSKSMPLRPMTLALPRIILTHTNLGFSRRPVNAIFLIKSLRYRKHQQTNGGSIQHHRKSGKMKNAKNIFAPAFPSIGLAENALHATSLFGGWSLS